MTFGLTPQRETTFAKRGLNYLRENNNASVILFNLFLKGEKINRKTIKSLTFIHCNDYVKKGNLKFYSEMRNFDLKFHIF